MMIVGHQFDDASPVDVEEVEGEGWIVTIDGDVFMGSVNRDLCQYVARVLESTRSKCERDALHILKTCLGLCSSVASTVRSQTRVH